MFTIFYSESSARSLISSKIGDGVNYFSSFGGEFTISLEGDFTNFSKFDKSYVIPSNY